MLFRKKPVVIEAEQFTPGDGVREHDIYEVHGHSYEIRFGSIGPYIVCNTLEGQMRGEYGDWIIKGVKGEIYPCKPDIFNITYEAV